MAVEAKNMNNFSPQMLTNGFMSSNNQAYGYNNSNNVNVQMGYVANFSTAMAENLNFSPFHQSMICDSVQPKNSMKAESGLTCNLPAAPRKRSRDSMEQFSNPRVVTQKSNSLEFASFLGEDISLQIQQQQLEIDQIVAHHTKKIRMELEERQKQHARLLVSAIGEGVVKKLNEKDEQIQRMGKLNMALQERVKSLCVENQLWRDLAQTNEAAAISLRSNLEQVLAHVSEERISAGVVGGGAADEGESCCGSNDVCGEEEVAGRRTLAWEEVAAGGGSGGGERKCRKCGEGEACVLLLPCRHLCVCSTCGSQLVEACPVCNSRMTATVHVNMS